jgi:diguanylate cyclase (GGDEF)-like protein
MTSKASEISTATELGAAVRGEVRVLMVEDMVAEAELVMHQLRRAGIQGNFRRVARESDLRDALRQFRPDIVLSDFTMPGFDGMSALKIVREAAPDVPFMFVSGTIGEELAIEALRQGAVDYVLKSNLRRLVPAISRALEDAAARRQRQQQEAQIARLTRVLRMLSGINSMVLRIRDQTELFEEACRLAVTIGGYASAVVILRQLGSRIARSVACAGDEDSITETLRAAQAADTGASILEQVLKTSAAFVGSDTLTGSLTGAFKFRCIVALPLQLETTAIGVLVLTGMDPGALSDEELQMLREVAANLSFALQYLQKDTTVHFLSYFDAHTGLAKRSLFCERIERLLQRTDGHKCCAVAVVDIEQLSVINDSFGRHTGDLLLYHVADRLRRHFPNTEWLAQFGGGTFAIALESSDDATPMTRLQGTLAAVFGVPFEMQANSIPVTVKSGLALYPDDGKDAASLVQKAEAALRDARTSGQRHQHYRSRQHSEVVARLALEHKLREAITQQQFELHYQPIVNAVTGRIETVEGLIRWRNPESGLTSPAAFLPLLESTGLIVEVGEWVIERAAADCQQWRQLGLPPVRIAVNISPVQLQLPDFSQRLLRHVQPWASPTCGLDIEITEGMLLEDRESQIAKLAYLRAQGVRIAIDDFGTGYSSLSRMSELPVDTLKVDRSFVARLPHDPSGQTLVRTVINLAHAFGLSVVSEGVETLEQSAMLRDVGCDSLQGFLFSAALRPDAMIALLAENHGRMPRPAPRVGGNEASGDSLDQPASNGRT